MAFWVKKTNKMEFFGKKKINKADLIEPNVRLDDSGKYIKFPLRRCGKVGLSHFIWAY